MSTIVVRKTSLTATQETASSTPVMRETCYHANSYEAALVELGRILLKDDDTTDLISVRRISNQCQKHWKSLPRIDYSVRTFSDWVSNYFLRCGEIRGKDLRVRYKTELSSTRRDPDQFLQFVRVQAYN